MPQVSGGPARPRGPLTQAPGLPGDGRVSQARRPQPPGSGGPGRGSHGGHGRAPRPASWPLCWTLPPRPSAAAGHRDLRLTSRCCLSRCLMSEPVRADAGVAGGVGAGQDRGRVVSTLTVPPRAEVTRPSANVTGCPELHPAVKAARDLGRQRHQQGPNGWSRPGPTAGCVEEPVDCGRRCLQG